MVSYPSIPLLSPTRLESSLIEQDILLRIQELLDQPQEELALLAFVSWLDRPLLLWDIVHEAAHSPDFLTFADRLHTVCQLFIEHKLTTPESYVRLVDIYHQQLLFYTRHAA